MNKFYRLPWIMCLELSLQSIRHGFKWRNGKALQKFQFSKILLSLIGIFAIIYALRYMAMIFKVTIHDRMHTNCEKIQFMFGNVNDKYLCLSNCRFFFISCIRAAIKLIIKDSETVRKPGIWRAKIALM